MRQGFQGETSADHDLYPVLCKDIELKTQPHNQEVSDSAYLPHRMKEMFLLRYKVVF